MGKCREVAARCRGWCKRVLGGMEDDVKTKDFWEDKADTQKDQWKEVNDFMTKEFELDEDIPEKPSYQQVQTISDMITKEAQDRCKQKSKERKGDLLKSK